MSHFEGITSFLECLGDAIVIVDESSQIVFANAACKTKFGYKFGEMERMSVRQLMGSSSVKDHASLVKQFVNSNIPAREMMTRGDMFCVDASGNSFVARISIASVTIDKKQYGVATIQDFTGLKKEIDQLEVNLHQDNLTSLYNRRYLQKVIEPKSRIIKAWKNIGVVFIDLNKFKPINDTYGHDVGDSVLKIVSRRILSQIRFDDLVFRMGGDEFLVFLNLTPAPDKSAALRYIVTKIYNAVSSPIQTKNINASVGLSMGCGLYPDQGDDIELLIKLADQAMYSAKKSATGIEYIS